LYFAYISSLAVREEQSEQVVIMSTEWKASKKEKIGSVLKQTDDENI